MTLLAERPNRARRSPDRDAKHLLLEDVSWEYYLQTLEELEGRHHRVTYDNGRMEIMTPPIGRFHEYTKTCVGRLIETYAYETDLNITGLGQVTTQREDLKKGVEPDECYWVQTPPPPIERSWLKLDEAPRPDLVVEIDITSAMIEREPIYAAFGVPEIWRFKSPRMEVVRLNKAGKYRRVKRSHVFPHLPIEKFNEFLSRALKGDQHGAVMALRRWIKSSQK